MKIDHLLVVSLGTIVGLTACSSDQKEEVRKPNILILLADDAADRVARAGNGAAVLAIRHEGRAEAGDAADAVGAGNAPAVAASGDGHAAGGGGVVGGAHDTAGVAHAARGGDRGAVLAVLDGAG